MERVAFVSGWTLHRIARIERYVHWWIGIMGVCLLFGQPVWATSTGYVWLTLVAGGWLAAHLRDLPMKVMKGPPFSNDDLVDTRHAFNALAIVATMVVKLSACISMLVWLASGELIGVAHTAGGYLAFIAICEFLVDMLVRDPNPCSRLIYTCTQLVEAPRLALVVQGKHHALFLRYAWAPLHVDDISQVPTTIAGCVTYRRWFKVREATATEMINGHGQGAEETETILMTDHDLADT